LSETGTDPTEVQRRPARKWRVGLSGKLLLLTILFVMVAEVLIYVPSVANFRLNWLNDRLASAHTAALVLEAAPSGMVPKGLANEILTSIGARAVADGQSASIARCLRYALHDRARHRHAELVVVDRDFRRIRCAAHLQA
jgi:hypothetical protein